jgi:hypothetical protein
LGLLFLLVPALLPLQNCAAEKKSKKVTNPFPDLVEGSYLGLVDLAPMTQAQIAEHALLFTVLVNGKPKSKGSGVCLGTKIGLTNWHVAFEGIKSADASLTVQLQNGKTSEVKRIAMDFAYFDTVLVEFAEPICAGGVAVQDPAKPLEGRGAPLVNISNPGKQQFASFVGSLDSASPSRLGETPERLGIDWVPYETEVLASQTLGDAGVGPGSSGSGVFQNGRMIGIVFAAAVASKKVIIIDSSFLTLKPFAELEWIDASFEAFKSRQENVIGLESEDGMVVPLPRSLSLRLPSKKFDSHSSGDYENEVRAIIGDSMSALTYKLNSSARSSSSSLRSAKTMCWIRSTSTAAVAGLVIAAMKQEAGMASCQNVGKPGAMAVEIVALDADNDGVTEKASAWTGSAP